MDYNTLYFYMLELDDSSCDVAALVSALNNITYTRVEHSGGILFFASYHRTRQLRERIEGILDSSKLMKADSQPAAI